MLEQLSPRWGGGGGEEEVIDYPTHQFVITSGIDFPSIKMGYRYQSFELVFKIGFQKIFGPRFC